MTWQRKARLAVAVVGLSCAAAVFYFSRERRQATPAPPPATFDAKATAEATNVKSVRYDFKTGKVAYTLEFAHSATYEDGSSRYDTIHLTTMRDDRKQEVWADAAVEKGKAASGDTPAEIALSGHVRVETSTGLHLETGRATYVDATGIVTAPEHVTFSRGRVSGEGENVTYDRPQDTLTIPLHAHITMTPDEAGHGAIDATSASMVIARNERSVRMDQQARLVREQETLTADRAVLHFTQDEHGLDALELHGSARVTPQPGAAGSPPDMRASDITLSFHADGRTLSESRLTGGSSVVLTGPEGSRTVTGDSIDVALAPDGQTLTRLNADTHVVVTLPPADDTPGRTIKAAKLVSQGDERGGLKSARFDGGVEFVEEVPASRGQPATTRTGTSAVLLLALNGDLGAIDQADFRDNVQFKDGQVAATAYRAVYFATKGDLRLSPSEAATSRLPHVDDDTLHVDARAIALKTDSHDLHAQGDVKSRMLPSADSSGAGHSPGLFEPGKVVFGSGADLVYASATHQATFTSASGTLAQLWQEQSQNKVIAETITFNDDSGNLDASGRVFSTFTLDDTTTAEGGRKTEAAEPSQNQATGRTLRYVDADRKATYTGDAGAPASLVGPDGTITAQRIDLFLAKEQRALDRIEADADVHYIFPAKQREAKADHLTYVSDNQEYTLKGRPARAKLLNQDGVGCSLHSNIELQFSKSGGMTTPPGGTVPMSSTKMDCKDPIK